MGASVVVNFDELIGCLSQDINVIMESPELKIIEKIVSDNLNEIVKLLSGIVDRVCEQHSEGFCIDVPAIIADYEHELVFDEPVLITGIAYSQTGWKDTDCFSVVCDDTVLFDRIYTKELGQYKHFNRYMDCSRIKIIYHSNSGNSKLVWFDIDYLKRKVRE